MRTWLVTGACGFVGSHVVDHLVERGEPVLATDLPGADTRYADRAGAPFLPMDVTRPDEVAAVFAEHGPFEGVFHLAEVVDYSAPVERMRAVHVDGTRNLIDAMADGRSGRLMVLSSGGVYGRPDRIPSEETFPRRPITMYDETKVEQELLVEEAIAASGFDATIVRPAAIYGPRSRKRAAIPLFLMALGQLPAIPGKGDVYAALVHVADVAGACRHLAGLPGASGGVYNVADDTLMTLEDILFMLAPHVDAKLSHFHMPLWGLRLVSWISHRRAARLGRSPRIEKDALELIVHDSFMSNRKLKESGYALRYPDYVVGMVETIEWYKSRNWLWRPDEFRLRMGAGVGRAPPVPTDADVGANAGAFREDRG